MFDYAAACAKATTDQGLDPLVEALTEEEISHYVEQTGGFCMVVTVPCPEGTYAVTHDGDWLVGWFPGNTWAEASDEPAETDTWHKSLPAVLDEIKERVQ